MSKQFKISEITQEIVGTILYMAPELFFLNECDPFKTDIWSIGILFDELICGSPFFYSD